MFTGLIEELGTIADVGSLADGRRIRVAASVVTSDLKNGDSIAVNGVCLTALDVHRSGFFADISPETLSRTTLGKLGAGARVNLERSVTPNTRLGGHIVQGHVDGCGEFLAAEANGDFWTVTVGFPRDLGRYFVHKGSVAVDGISLTIAELNETNFQIAVIPKTWEMTDLSTLKQSDSVNLEVDVIAKYVERMLQFRPIQ